MNDANPKMLKYMTEPELNEHLSEQLRFIKSKQTPDTIGSMLVIFQDNGITQYGATIDPETAPQSLRELADRIERRETVKRGEPMQDPPAARPMLLPPAEGLCRICAVDHEPDRPHNPDSLFYQMRFKMRYGRGGTWADAAAHMPVEQRKRFRQVVEFLGGIWTEPPEGVDPIAEPIAG